MQLKKLIVHYLEHWCLHHPWWPINWYGNGVFFTSCSMAYWSWKLNKRWKTGLWNREGT